LSISAKPPDSFAKRIAKQPAAALGVASCLASVVNLDDYSRSGWLECKRRRGAVLPVRTEQQGRLRAR